MLLKMQKIANINKQLYAIKCMDKIDEGILRLLNGNARQSFRELARKMHISLATVAARIKRMEAGGLIRGYAPRLSAEKMGLDLTALISVRISHGKLMNVQEKISRDPRVYGVYDITGEWDSLIIARFKSRSELNGFVKMLLATEYVERTNTSIAMNVIKEDMRIFV